MEQKECKSGNVYKIYKLAKYDAYYSEKKFFEGKNMKYIGAQDGLSHVFIFENDVDMSLYREYLGAEADGYVFRFNFSWGDNSGFDCELIEDKE